MASPPIDKLASDAQASISKYLDYLQSQSLPLPSHDAGPCNDLPAGTTLPEDIIEARDVAINACQEISLLLGGPARSIISGASEQFMAICLRFVCRHDIPSKVPLSDTISADELAGQCSLNKSDLLRALRCAQAWHLFQEPAKEQIRHTAASRLLKEDERSRPGLRMLQRKYGPPVPHLVDALTKWPGSEDPAQTAWSLSHGANESAFSYWNKHPKIAAPVVAGMSYWNSAPGFEAHQILNQFDFSHLPSEARFVDLGGSLGRTCIEVACRHSHISTIVQDLPTTIDNVPSDIVPAEIRDRVEFMKHNISKPQPVHGADIYYFRAVLHDWSDASCVEILQNLIPALKPGARILVTDIYLPRFGEASMMEERRLRSLDMTMKVFANARERSEEDWERLFSTADKRFGSFKIQLPQNSQRLALISVVLEP